MGSSHGHSRIIRLAYFEHPSYVPLLHRSFELWRELEASSGERLLNVTGSIDAGWPGSRVFEGSLQSCRVHDLEHEILTAQDVAARFPAYRLPEGMHAIFQPDGGFLDPERCIAAHVALARSSGAEVTTGQRVLGWTRAQGGVVVHLDGEDVRARQLVTCAGPWTAKILPGLATLLRPERQVVAWFATREPGPFDPGNFPVFVMESGPGIFYGFPMHGTPGFKIGKYHHRGELVDPDSMDRSVHDADEDVLRECVREVFPLANGPMLHSSACIFTNTPDEHFIIDRLPGAPEVLVVSACSGHGFKFCSVIGEIVADLVTRDATSHDITPFGLGRFPTPLPS